MDDDGEPYSEDIYEIREVYYNKLGEITALSEDAIAVTGDGETDLEWHLTKMTEGLAKETIDLDTLVFAADD